MHHRLIPLLVAALAIPASAVSTSHWQHTSEADFRKGRFENVVVSNLGDLKLSRAVKTLLEQDPRVSSVYALAEAADGTLYAGTGPHGIVLQVKGDNISTLLTLEDENIFCLLVDRENRLLIGTGGDKGRILRVDKPGAKPVEIFSADSVQYVWQMRQTADGMLYAATGSNGQIFEIRPDNSHAVVLDTSENNILSLIADGGDLLYAGSDPNGLVYRINRKTHDVFVLYDAPEPEISALALNATGNLYVGTAQAEPDERRPSPAAVGERSGRPEGGEAATPLPSAKPQDPARPQPARPGPNDPQPIPRNTSRYLILEPPDAGDEDDLPAPQPGGPIAVAAAPAPNPAPGAASAVPARNASGSRSAAPVPAAPSNVTNAIYRIEPSGFVSEIFRQPVMVLCLLEQNGVLLVGTGSEGLIYQVNPEADETLVLANVDPKQVLSMLATRDGQVMLGMANVGGLARMSGGFAKEGTYTSPVLDAAQISQFGKLRLKGSLPGGSSLTIATRSGNLQDTGGKGWSSWSDEQPASEYVQVTSPAARYLQYRLSFHSKDGSATAVVDQVDIAHRLPNLAPQIRTIRVTAVPEPAPAGGVAAAAAGRPPQTATGRMRNIAWEAVDANADAMEYTLFFRSGASGPWIRLADKLREPQYLWDTRGVPDGQYQIKVVASDAKSNPLGAGRESTRVSDAVVVDNTPPTIGDIKVQKLARGVKVEARIVDRESAVASVQYAINSKDDWQAVAASDSIFDSPEEGIVVTLEDLAAGAYQITLRAMDESGNMAFETVPVTISPPAGK